VSLDAAEHSLSSLSTIQSNILAICRDGAQLLFQRMVEGNGVGTTANILRHVVVARPDNLLACLLYDIQEFERRQPLCPVVGDGLLDQCGNLLEIDRVLFHALRDRALGEACDHVRLGGRRRLLGDSLVECLFVENIDRGCEGDDFVGVDVLVQELANPLLVELEIDVLLVTLANG